VAGHDAHVLRLREVLAMLMAAPHRGLGLTLPFPQRSGSSLGVGRKCHCWQWGPTLESEIGLCVVIRSDFFFKLMWINFPGGRGCIALQRLKRLNAMKNAPPRPSGSTHRKCAVHDVVERGRSALHIGMWGMEASLPLRPWHRLHSPPTPLATATGTAPAVAAGLGAAARRGRIVERLRRHRLLNKQ